VPVCVACSSSSTSIAVTVIQAGLGQQAEVSSTGQVVNSFEAATKPAAATASTELHSVS
jgi:hypothetical protein